MPAFTRKPEARFYCKGVNLRLPIDQIPEGEFSLLMNLRSYVDGQLTSRPGLTLLENSFGSSTYLHSLLRFNDSNPDTLVGACRFVGANDGNLYLTDALTPITTVVTADTGYSGNPLSLVPFRPLAASSAAVYIGDSNQMAEVFFRPGDTLASAAVYTIGLPPPNGASADAHKMPIPAPGGSGNLTGTYWWRFATRNIYTGKRSNPSAPTRQSIVSIPSLGVPGLCAGLTLSAQSATMVIPDESAGSSSFETDVIVDIYRFGGTVFEWKLVASGSPGDSFKDDIPDLNLLSAPSYPVDANGSPALVQPFPTLDIYRSGNLTFSQSTLSGSISAGSNASPASLTSAGHNLVSGFVVTIAGFTGNWAVANGVWQVTVTGANTFTIPLDSGSLGGIAGSPTFAYAGPVTVSIGSVAWAANWQSYIPGTEIIVDAGAASSAVHLYRWAESASVAEILEAVPDGLSTGVSYSFKILSPIMAGRPLSHLWGPWQPSGGPIFILGCGDPLNPGTVYWSNGNDADSSALTNSAEVTDPSEPLVNGIIFDGRCYVWSTRRMFEGIPDPSQDGNFLWRQIPNAGGLYAPWGVADCGLFMAYIGYDGIYKSQGVSSESLTDDQLYPLFPHDNTPGFTVVRGGETLYPPDPTVLQKWRLAWQYGELYFDYIEQVTGHARTWLRGTRPGTDRGWMLDDYHFDGAMSRATEVTPTASSPNTGVSDAILGIGGSLFQFTGGNDASFAIAIVLETRLDDAGEDRAQKLWGDAAFTIVTNKSGMTTDLTLQVIGDTIAGGQPSGITSVFPITNTGGTQVTQVISINLLNRTLGVRILGSISGYSPEFYGWEPTWVVKPADTPGRIDDWTDDGNPTNKYLMGCIIEGNTSTASGTDLVAQSNLISVVSASRPFVSGDVGSWLVIVSGTSWIPGAYLILGVTGVTATLDHNCALAGVGSGVWTLGAPKVFQVQGDGGFVGATITVSHPGQTEFPYSWTPFETHEMRLVPQDSAAWREFKVTWVWNDYPEFSAGIEDFTKLPNPQYIRGFELEVSTKSALVQFQFQNDLGNVVLTSTVQTSVRDIAVFGINPPVIASEVRVVPLQPWEKFNLRLISDEYPDLGRVSSPWTAPRGGSPAYIRGVNIRGDTQGSNISVQVITEGGAIAYTIPVVNLSGQTVQNYPIPPFVSHLVRLVPSGLWRYFDSTWEAETYPELTTEYSPILTIDNGHTGFVREVILALDSGGTTQEIQVLEDGGVAVTPNLSFVASGKTFLPFAFNPPFEAHAVQFKPQGLVRLWTGEITWTLDTYPELDTKQTSVEKFPGGGCKFVQGLRLTADTNGATVVFQIWSEFGLQARVSGAFSGKSTIAFPRVNEISPFFAHEVWVIPEGRARIFEEDIEWIYEPAPDLGTSWTTPPVSGNFKNFWAMRYIWLGYLGASSTVFVDVTLDSGFVESYSFPASAGYTRQYQICSPSKSKIRSFRVWSASAFRLYKQDSFILAKEWGRPYDNFSPLQVFGDLSLESGARI